MEFKALIALLHKERNIKKMLVSAAKIGGPVAASRDTLNPNLELIRKHLLKNQHHKAVAIFAALLLWDANKTIAKARNKGVFRPSRYGFDGRGIKALLDATSVLRQNIQLNDFHLLYLKSVQELVALAPEARKLRISLCERMATRSDLVLKTLLAYLNIMYSAPWIQDDQRSPKEMEHWSVEDMAEAFSTLYEMYRTELPENPKAWQLPDWRLKSLRGSIYEKLLIDAACLNQLREAEAYLDAMPYQVTGANDCISITSIDLNLEKAIRLGYIQTELQRRVRVHKLSETGQTLSIKSFIDSLMDAGLRKLFQIVDRPYRRLVFALPNTSGFVEILSSNELFLEESAILLGYGIDTFHSKVDVSMPVTLTLTVMDLIKIQRLFHIINWAFQDALEQIDDPQERLQLLIQSTVMVIKKEDFEETLNVILPEEKIKDAISYLTLKEADTFIDVLYKPLIEIGKFFVIAPAVAAQVNMMRNIVPANQLHSTRDLKNDPMEVAVATALREAGFLVERNFNHAFRENCETDMLAWRNGDLFVFECKNPYLPCSAHEMRNTYGHLEKAEYQLDRRLEYLRDLNFQQSLFDKLGWDCKPTPNIHSAIINANRVFSGYTIGQHPVRQAHEFINVISRGRIDRNLNKPPLRFWISDQFQNQDLIDYLEGRSIIKNQLGQLVPRTIKVPIGKRLLAFERYTLCAIEANESMEAEYSTFTDIEIVAPDSKADV